MPTVHTLGQDSENSVAKPWSDGQFRWRELISFDTHACSWFLDEYHSMQAQQGCRYIPVYFSPKFAKDMTRTAWAGDTGPDWPFLRILPTLGTSVLTCRGILSAVPWWDKGFSPATSSAFVETADPEARSL